MCWSDNNNNNNNHHHRRAIFKGACEESLWSKVRVIEEAYNSTNQNQRQQQAKLEREEETNSKTEIHKILAT